MKDGFEFVCNCKATDVPKIKRLAHFGFALHFGGAHATPGYTAEENNEAGFRGVYVRGQ